MGLQNVGLEVGSQSLISACSVLWWCWTKQLLELRSGHVVSDEARNTPQGGCDVMSSPMFGFLMSFRAMLQAMNVSEERKCLGRSRERSSEGMQMEKVTWKRPGNVWTSRKSTKLMLAWLSGLLWDKLSVEQRQCFPAATLQFSSSFYATFDL